MSIDVERLVELLSIETKKQGDALWARCPFEWHSDSKASWSVLLDKGVHYCFGCQAGGDAVDLVASKYGITRGGAWRWLLDHGLVAERATSVGVDVVVSAEHKRFVMPLGVVTSALDDWPTPARRYALGRGLDAVAVERWSIGVAASGRLAGRIVVPIWSGRGVLASYSARTFVDDGLRYLTPNRDERPDLDAVFGSNDWPAAEQRRSLVVCEGVLDAIACWQAGAGCVAAFNGSSPSTAQLAQVASFKQLIVASDRDAAGDRLFAQLAALSRWIDVERARLPAGIDPSAMLVRDRARLVRCLDSHCGDNDHAL